MRARSAELAQRRAYVRLAFTRQLVGVGDGAAPAGFAPLQDQRPCFSGDRYGPDVVLGKEVVVTDVEAIEDDRCPRPVGGYGGATY